MTNQELQAKLQRMEYALNDAARALSAICELTKNVDYHPNAPMEKRAPYTMGAIAGTAARGLADAKAPN
jgi:hypothetical protein